MSDALVVEPPGGFRGAYSALPFVDAVRFLKKMESTARAWQDSAGAPVFKAHPGRRSVLIADLVAAEYFLKAGADLLDRESDGLRGPTRTRLDLMGNVGSALYSRGQEHEARRSFTETWMAERRDALGPAIAETTRSSHAIWEREGSFELFPAVAGWASGVAWRWLLGVNPPGPRSLLAWAAEIVEPVVDTPVAKVVANALVPRCPAHIHGIAADLRESAQRSPLYPALEARALAAGLTAEQAPGLIATTVALNASGAPTLSMFGTLAAMATTPEVRARFAEEARRWDGSMAGLEALPYLDRVWWEALRMFAQPRYVFRLALQDFVLPAGDGRSYAIRRGDLLGVLWPLIYRDAGLFPDPNRFDPDRFERDPGLKERIFSMDVAPGAANRFGCAAAMSGEAALVSKALLAAFLRDHVWQLEPSPEFSQDLPLSVGPQDLRVVGFRHDRGEA